MIQKLFEDISDNDLKNLIGDIGANKIFLVTGKNAYKFCGAQDFIESALKGIDYRRFFEFEQNPKYEEAIRGTKIFMESNCDLILAIGGGSVMDMAKLINCFAANSHLNALDIVKNLQRPEKKGKGLVAIPTTAGTGSEATHFAVVYYDKRKYSVAHETLLPDVVVLNHAFTTTQPEYLSACAGMDALSQAIESYWSVGGTETSKKFAAEAIKLISANLEDVVNHPNIKNRKAMIKAAYLAGKAINISKTTAAHAVSYAFTTYYGTPHGHAVFLTLPEFFEYNYGVGEADKNDPRGVAYTKQSIDEMCHFFGVTSAVEGKQYLRKLATGMGISLSFDALGITDYEAKITDNVNMERMGNNPRKISKKQLAVLLNNRSQ